MSEAMGKCVEKASNGEMSTMCDFMKCFVHELDLKSDEVKDLMKCYAKACGWC